MQSLESTAMPVAMVDGARGLKPALVSLHIRCSKNNDHLVCMRLIRSSSRQSYRFQQVINHEHS